MTLVVPKVLILGMGRVVLVPYDELRSRYGKVSLGVEVREGQHLAPEATVET
ncbi:hypothetical protein OK016_04255 [Vibrio chagasii]|nr:hypothetical protein [Vibrio chagasii]